jgi:hypothetical protein
VHSRRTLKIHCSAKALAFGVWGGVVRSTLMLAAGENDIERVGEFGVPVVDEEAKLLG